LTAPNAHFVELSDEVIQQREGGVPDGMLQMMDSFQVPLSTCIVETGNSPQVEQTGSYYEFFKSMRLRKIIAVNQRLASLMISPRGSIMVPMFLEAKSD